jgi:hypothetical protein
LFSIPVDIPHTHDCVSIYLCVLEILGTKSMLRIMQTINNRHSYKQTKRNEQKRTLHRHSRATFSNATPVSPISAWRREVDDDDDDGAGAKASEEATRATVRVERSSSFMIFVFSVCLVEWQKVSKENNRFFMCRYSYNEANLVVPEDPITRR